MNRVGVRVYILCHQKKFVIERTRDLNYLQFVATDFSLKTISPSAGENSGDLAHSPCYSAVSALLMNPLPDCTTVNPIMLAVPLFWRD